MLLSVFLYLVGVLAWPGLGASQPYFCCYYQHPFSLIKGLFFFLSRTAAPQLTAHYARWVVRSSFALFRPTRDDSVSVFLNTFSLPPPIDGSLAEVPLTFPSLANALYVLLIKPATDLSYIETRPRLAVPFIVFDPLFFLFPGPIQG